MTVDLIATIVAGILLVVAAAGVVFPVLPGSLLAIGTLLGWALIVGPWLPWVVAIIGVVLCIIGWSASAVLTGRRLKELQVPGWSIVVAVVAGIVGLFLIPIAGIFIGFAVGLFVSEWIRHGELSEASYFSWETIKAMGKGVVVEFVLLCLAAAVWSAGAFTHLLVNFRQPGA